jgi:hypothetical protein
MSKLMRGGSTMLTCCNIIMLIIMILIIMYILGNLEIDVVKEGFKGQKLSGGAIFGIFIASMMACTLLISATHDGALYFQNIGKYFTE